MVGDFILSGWSGWGRRLDLDDGDRLNLDGGMDLELCYVYTLHSIWVNLEGACCGCWCSSMFLKSSYPIIRFPMTKYLFLISTFIPTLELSRYKLVNQ